MAQMMILTMLIIKSERQIITHFNQKIGLEIQEFFSTRNLVEKLDLYLEPYFLKRTNLNKN